MSMLGAILPSSKFRHFCSAIPVADANQLAAPRLGVESSSTRKKRRGKSFSKVDCIFCIFCVKITQIVQELLMIHSVNQSQSNFTLSPRLSRGQIELLDTEGIAHMLSLSRTHVVGRITKRPDFPTPIINLSQRVRRWLRSDVEAWVLKSGKK